MAVTVNSPVVARSINESAAPASSAPAASGGISAAQDAALHQGVAAAEAISQGSNTNTITQTAVNTIDQSGAYDASEEAAIATAFVNPNTAGAFSQAGTAQQQASWYQQLYNAAVNAITNDIPAAPEVAPVAAPVAVPDDTSAPVAAVTNVQGGASTTTAATDTSTSGTFTTSTIAGSATPNTAVYSGNGTLLGQYDANGNFVPTGTSSSGSSLLGTGDSGLISSLESALAGSGSSDGSAATGTQPSDAAALDAAAPVLSGTPAVTTTSSASSEIVIIVIAIVAIVAGWWIYHRWKKSHAGPPHG